MDTERTVCCLPSYSGRMVANSFGTCIFLNAQSLLPP